MIFANETVAPYGSCDFFFYVQAPDTIGSYSPSYRASANTGGDFGATSTRGDLLGTELQAVGGGYLGKVRNQWNCFSRVKSTGSVNYNVIKFFDFIANDKNQIEILKINKSPF